MNRVKNDFKILRTVNSEDATGYRGGERGSGCGKRLEWSILSHRRRSGINKYK